MGRRTLSIILLVIGISILLYGFIVLATSFVMAEGGLIRPIAILALIFGFIVFFYAIIRLKKSSSENSDYSL